MKIISHSASIQVTYTIGSAIGETSTTEMVKEEDEAKLEVVFGNFVKQALFRAKARAQEKFLERAKVTDYREQLDAVDSNLKRDVLSSLIVDYGHRFDPETDLEQWLEDQGWGEAQQGLRLAYMNELGEMVDKYVSHQGGFISLKGLLHRFYFEHIDELTDNIHTRWSRGQERS